MIKLNKLQLPQRGFKNEALFTSWFGGEIKKVGGFFHKISDESKGLKPFDAIAAIDGICMSIEFKMITTKTCYPYRLLRGSSIKNPGGQVKGLKTYMENGGMSLVVVYNKKVNEYAVFDFADLDLDTKYDFNVQEIPMRKPI